MMKQLVELPLIEPMYSAYQYQGPGTAIAAENPSIRNWYLNEAVNLVCSRHFLHGLTTPELDVENSSWIVNPHLEMKYMSMEFLGCYMHPVIRKMLDNGYYVYYYGLDDFYIPGKSWYQERHFNHDGLICGYNQKEKTYCLYAYDEQWKYTKFWVPQASLDDGRKSSFKMGIIGSLCGLKAKPYPIPFEPGSACNKLKGYLDSTLQKFPLESEGSVTGAVVHLYIIEYLKRIQEGFIPRARTDRRIFRLIWEHKKAMHQRIEAIESVLGPDFSFSKQYFPLVKEADSLRILYATYHMKPHDSVLPVLQNRLYALMLSEQKILDSVINKSEKEL